MEYAESDGEFRRRVLEQLAARESELDSLREEVRTLRSAHVLGEPPPSNRRSRRNKQRRAELEPVPSTVSVAGACSDVSVP